MSYKTPHVIRYAYTDLKIVSGYKGSTPFRKWNAECVLCGVNIQESVGTTSGFVRHLRNKHRDMYKEYSSNKHHSVVKLEDCDNTLLETLESGIGIDEKLSGPTQKVKDAIENLFVKCPLPISLSSNQHFLEFLQQLNPAFALPSFGDICNVHIPTLYNDLILKSAVEFSSAKYVSLSLNFWHHKERVYMAVSGHCFKGLKSFENLLGFYVLKEAKLVENAVLKWNEIIETLSLKGKITFLIINMASKVYETLNFLNSFIQDSNKLINLEGLVGEDKNEWPTQLEYYLHSYVGVIDEENIWKDIVDLEEAFIKAGEEISLTHIECFQTSLLLVLKDGINKLGSVHALINKCCKSIDVLLRNESFVNFCDLNSIKKSEIGWIKLFDDLVFIEKLDTRQLNSLLENTGDSYLILSSLELESLQELINILSPFVEIVLLLESSHYPTLGIVVPSIVSLHKILTSLQQDIQHHKAFINELSQSLTRRFCGLFERIVLDVPAFVTSKKPFNDIVYVMAAVLDPRYRFIWLEVDHPGSSELKYDLKKSVIDSMITIAKNMNLVNEDQKEDVTSPPTAKRSRLSIGSVFASYENENLNKSRLLTTRSLIESYLSFINEKAQTWETVNNFEHFEVIQPLIELSFCAPGKTRRVERVAASGGIFIHSNYGTLKSQTLEQLAYIKCNQWTHHFRPN